MKLAPFVALWSPLGILRLPTVVLSDQMDKKYEIRGRGEYTRAELAEILCGPGHNICKQLHLESNVSQA